MNWRLIGVLLISALLATGAPRHHKHRRNHRSMVVSMSKWAGQGAGIGMFGGPIGAGIGAAAGAGFGYFQDRRAYKKSFKAARAQHLHKRRAGR